MRKLVFGAAAALAMIAAPAAFAADCPASKVGVDVMKPGPMMPKKVTDKVISSIDLKSYDIDGRQMRLRRLVVQPGGIVPWHSHEKRPANIYVVSGQITEYRSTCAVPILHTAGDVTAESGNLSHWWKNNSKHVTVLLSADILPPEEKPAATM